MSGSAERIRGRLPSLWRPEPETQGLFPDLLAAVGRLVDRLDLETSDLLQARWFGTADAARWSPFFHRRRELAAVLDPAPAATAESPTDGELESFPYLDDLPRLGSLLGLLPWPEPFAQKTEEEGKTSIRSESVEHYAERLARIVAVYRNGVGTLAALRGIAEAELPIDLLAPPGLEDRPLEVVELAAGPPVEAAAAGRSTPRELVGPLMRWPVRHDGVAPAPVSWTVVGQAPVADEIGPAEWPLLELFAAGSRRIRRGLGYDGTLAPGQALRVRPAHSSWLAEANGVARATSRPRGEVAADPVAPGPWEASAAPGGAPAGTRAFALGADGFLYAAGGGELWRFGAEGWKRAVSGLPEVRCLLAQGDRLRLGTALGLLTATLHPAEGEDLQVSAPANPAGVAVHALALGRDGTLWLGTEQGAARLVGEAVVPFGLGAAAETRTPIRAVHEERDGTLLFGGDLGLFRFFPGSGDWWWYAGEQPSEAESAWRPFYPDKPAAERGFPLAHQVFLPPVRAIHRGPDSTLWLGTAAGLARYGARSSGGTAFSVALEALTPLGTGAVHALAEDERGGIWAATDAGLFRHDGRDLWQRRGTNLERLPIPRASSPDSRLSRGKRRERLVFSSALSFDLWRFDRTAGRWQRRDPDVRPATWLRDETAPVPAEAAVRAIAWTDGAAAELGAVEGGRFVAAADLDPAPVEARLRARWKPDEERIVAGGLPALPRLPVGLSTWRYLELENGAPAFNNLPAWTREGRLIAPPAEPRAVEEGRWGVPADVAPDQAWSDFDEAAFAYLPSARVSLSHSPRGPLAVLVRLGTLSPDEALDPALLDRVFRGLEQVRPAGVRVLLAVNDEIVRGR